jgi:RHS repeat-associated protein
MKSQRFDAGSTRAAQDGSHGRRMTRGGLVLLALLAVVLACGVSPGVAAAESLCTDTWVGPAEGSWSTAADWSLGTVPTSTDVACIGSGKTVKIAEGADQTGVVQGAGAVAVTGGSLEVANGLEPSAIATLSVIGGGLIGAGEVDITSSFSAGGFSGAHMEGTGKTVIEPLASGTVNAGPDFTLSKRTLVNEGSLAIGEQAGIIGKEAATLINTGTLTVNGDTEGSKGLDVETGGATLTNRGTVQKTEGTGTTNIRFAIDNENTVKAASGTIQLEGGGTSGQEKTASWSAATGAQINFQSGTYALGTTVPLSGTISVVAATVTAGKVEGSTASLNISFSGCCVNGKVEINGESASTLSGLSLNGTLSGSGEVDVTNSFSAGGITSTIMLGSGKTVLKPGVSGTINNGPSLNMAKRTLVNEGNLTVALQASIDGKEGATILNRGTLTVNGQKEFTGGLLVETPGPTPLLKNTGIVQKTEGTGVTPIRFAFENYGTIEAHTGLFEITDPIIVASAENLLGSLNPSALAALRALCGDPVDCVTGNYSETQTDLAVGGRGVGLDLTRTYNALTAAKATTAGAFGYGWTSSFSDRLVVESVNHKATLYQANGSTVPFTEVSGGTFTGPAWSADALTGSAETGYILTLTDQTKFVFNGTNGRLESETDRNGNQTMLSYNEKGQLATITDPASRKITLAYNAEGLVESATDPMGHVVKYTYEAGNLASVTLPGELSPNWRFKYDTSHRMTLMIDGRGGETTNTYDSSNRVTAQKDPLGHTLKFEYGAFQTKITNEATGAVTLDQFSSSDQITAITHGYGTPSATTTKIIYNEANEPTSVTDGNGHTTTYEYDSAGNKTKMLDPESRETKWAYNSTHDVTSMTRPNGETTTITRDEHGNPTLISRPAPGSTTHETRFEYDSHGQTTSMTNPLGRKWIYEYDGKGDRTSETDPEGDKRTRAYNEDSQETSNVSPRGNVTGGEPSKYTTTIERDAQGRAVKITDPLGHITRFSYDGDGNRVTIIDPNGRETKTEYNAASEPVKVTLPNGATRETGYDAAGQLTSQTDGNKHTTTYARNVLEQITEIADPLLHKTTKSYDAAGNLASITDPTKRTTSFTYNKDNQPTKVTYSDGITPTVEYEYDKDGNRTSMTDGSGKTTYTYDQLDRLTKTMDGHGNTLSYEYDLANEQTKITYPNGKTVEHSYDKAGRMASVKDWLGNTTSFGYDPNSNLTTTTFPTGTNEIDHAAYNEADQQTEAKMSKGTETLASLLYTRDSNGQITKTVSKGLPGAETTETGYDVNERLSKAGSIIYEYDAANNPTKIGATTNTFNADNQLTEAAGVKYTYDEEGERTKTTPTSGAATTYGYDQAGDLTSVTRPKEGRIAEIKDTYAYNGDGLRISQTISGTTTFITLDHGTPTPLVASDGTNSYIYGPGGLQVEQINAEKPLFLHADQQASTRMLTSTTGTVQATMSYEPYGKLSGSTGTSTTPLGYTGQYTNSDTGLLYLRARSYDPSTAQFMSADPLSGETHTPYNYANDDPINLYDPTGLFSIGDVIKGAEEGVEEGAKAVGTAVKETGKFVINHPVIISAVGCTVGALAGPEVCAGAIAASYGVSTRSNIEAYAKGEINAEQLLEKQLIDAGIAVAGAAPGLPLLGTAAGRLLDESPVSIRLLINAYLEAPDVVLGLLEGEISCAAFR